MAFWIACSMKAIKEQIDEQPKIIKLFSINYARDLLSFDISSCIFFSCIIILKNSKNQIGFRTDQNDIKIFNYDGFKNKEILISFNTENGILPKEYYKTTIVEIFDSLWKKNHI